MTMSSTTESLVHESVGALVRDRLNRARVFEQFGIDFCCGGNRTLSDACAAAGVDPQEVARRLVESDTSCDVCEEVDWDNAPLPELIDHIVSLHHTFLRSELPRLESLFTRVVDAHGETHPELAELRQVFLAMKDELFMHMMKEEQVLFPMVKRLVAAEAGGQSLPQFHCGSVENPISAMEREHQAAGTALQRIRFLTDGFTPPADACETYRILLASLAAIETDLHLHIHKENNILFPKAADLEASVAGAGKSESTS